MKRFRYLFGMMVLLVLILGACSTAPAPTDETPIPTSGPNELRALMGAEMKLLEDAGIFRDFTSQTGIKIQASYKGGVDIRNLVRSWGDQNPGTFDIVGSPSPIWLTSSLIRDKQSVTRTYTGVIGVNMHAAEELGWNQETGITAMDIIHAGDSGVLKLAMPSASQDDAAANFFIAVLSAFKEGLEPLTQEDLSNPSIVQPAINFFKNVARGATNSADLYELFLNDKVSGDPQYNAVILPESMAIAMNRELEEKGEQPLALFYVADAINVQDYKLGWVAGLPENKQILFEKFVEYLRSPEIQDRLKGLGFRSGYVGMQVDESDPSIFNPEWGVEPQSEFVLADLPKDEVLFEALNLYQTGIRKPSFAVYCLDFSGSMNGEGSRQLKNAMDLLLDQSKASQVLLQATAKDVTIVYIFRYGVAELGIVEGNDAGTLKELSNNINALSVDGGTALFACAEEAINRIAENWDPETYQYSVILLTDGENTESIDGNHFIRFYEEARIPVPVYSIMFGNALRDQLQAFDVTTGTICDGRRGGEELILCFRNAKGAGG